MRAVVFLIIAGIAGVMAYLMFVGECTGGTVVRTEEQCQKSSGLSGDLCRTIFSRANDVARNSGAVYPDPMKCAEQYGPCMPHATVATAFVPVPYGFCVKTNGNALVSMEPVYRTASAQR
ncbi:MAG: DUF1190 domain-containing protein [Beijerinckiaceae bacterium]